MQGSFRLKFTNSAMRLNRPLSDSEEQTFAAAEEDLSEKLVELAEALASDAPEGRFRWRRSLVAEAAEGLLKIYRAGGMWP